MKNQKTINIKFEFAEKYKPFVDDILNSKHARYSLYGGRDSGKSTALYMMIILVVLSEGNVMVARRYKNSIKASSFNGIAKTIKKCGLEKYFIIPKSNLKITCKLTGYSIDFAGLDSFDKLKSAEAQEGVYKLLVFEEAQEINSRSICDEVISSYERGVGSEGFRTCWIFNPPPNRYFWLNTELRHTDEEASLLALHVSYKDIPLEWVGEQQYKEIQRLKKVNRNLYLYRYEGEAISVEDVVFENIISQTIEDADIDKWETEDDFVYQGLDFGYKPDPNAGVGCHYDIDNRVLYIYREFYKGELNNRQLSTGLQRAGFSQDIRLWCDSNEIKTINDLKDDGWDARAASKPKGSVKESFMWLQGLNSIVIDEERCPHTYDEFKNYHYEIDRDEQIMKNKLYKWDQADHSIAATRYALHKIIQKAGV